MFWLDRLIFLTAETPIRMSWQLLDSYDERRFEREISLALRGGKLFAAPAKNVWCPFPRDNDDGTPEKRRRPV
ncbi:MAG: uncharacterized protein KVP18_002130 [Porospora cf. gigantea A]|uniref:uncharacterized protein n=1 Tax=Porospora cf. gigantea A TaxID=2853593 RepID=UPI00355A5840|nr:MAG: hypothetical protein KVP18_002130 [Porospora cf. gigantea A]